MGELAVKTSLQPQSVLAYRMASSGASNLTALLQGASTAGSATLVRCPPETLNRLRSLNEAEIITLFTPVVPHPPSTALAKNMDPFEPLGRSLPRQVRHVPYRLDRGMTPTHADFLPASGAVIIVICSTDNVLNHSPGALEQQVRFAQDVAKSEETKTLRGVPMVLLLISSDSLKASHQQAVKDFSTLVTLSDYTPAALANAVGIMFGK